MRSKQSGVCRNIFFEAENDEPEIEASSRSVNEGGFFERKGKERVL